MLEIEKFESSILNYELQEILIAIVASAAGVVRDKQEGELVARGR
jgi:hypothetical protein